MVYTYVSTKLHKLRDVGYENRETLLVRRSLYSSRLSATSVSPKNGGHGGRIYTAVPETCSIRIISPGIGMRTGRRRQDIFANLSATW